MARDDVLGVAQAWPNTSVPMVNAKAAIRIIVVAPALF
jgi:hypothetical protein